MRKAIRFLILALLMFLNVFSYAKEITSTNNWNHSNIYIDASVQDVDLLRDLLKDSCSEKTFQLFSHGRPGELFIDGEFRDKEKLVPFLRQKMGSHVTHINIYGCEFGNGLRGSQAVAFIEKALGVSVSASTNVTGKDGDWDLEIGKAQDIISLPEYNGSFQTYFYKPTAAELNAPDQESYTAYTNSKANIVDNATITDFSSSQSNTVSMMWSDNSTTFGNPNTANYDPIHNTLIITPTTPLNDVSGLALWAIATNTATGDAPIKDFTVTVEHASGVWTSGTYTTEAPTVQYTPNYGQYFQFGQGFDGVTKITINTLDGWYRTSTGYTSALGVATAAGENPATYAAASNSTTALYGYNMTLAELRIVQNSCYDGTHDSDGDGIGDVCDLDDDNDGILDTAECAATLVDFSSISSSSSATRLDPGDPSATITTFMGGGALNRTITVSAPTTANGAASFFVGSESGSIIRFEDNGGYTAGTSYSNNFTFSKPSTITLSASNVIGASNINQSDKFVFTLPAGNGWTVVSSTNATITNSGNVITIQGSSTSGAGGASPFADFVIKSNYPITTLTAEHANLAGQVTPALNSGRFSMQLCADTDGDGIENYLDLDSDGDGCPDAVEGGDNITQAMLDANNMINVAADGVTAPVVVDANGVPVITNTGSTYNVDGQAQGQIIGLSATVNPTLVAGTAGNSQYITVGQTPSAITLTGSTGSIQWQSSTDNVSFTNISGATSATYSPGALNTMMYYKAVVTSAGGCTATSNTVQVVVTDPCAITATNPDSDGDGISNACDLDDDNDGILDTNEGSCTTTNEIAYNPTTYEYPASGTTVYNTTETGYRFDAASGSPLGFATVENVYRFSGTVTNSPRWSISQDSNRNAGLSHNGMMTYDLGMEEQYTNPLAEELTPSYFNLWALDFQTIVFEMRLWESTPNALGGTLITNQNDFYLQVSNGTDATFSISEISSGLFRVKINQTESSASAINIKSTLGKSLSKIELKSVDGTYSPGLLKEFLGVRGLRTYQLCTDTDGDGIPNHLDLDSDNDGCLDAIEGAGSFTSGALTTPSGSVSVGTGSTATALNFGTAVDAITGVPTAVGASGQNVGGSQNLAVNECQCTTKDTLDWTNVTWAPGVTTGTFSQGNLSFNVVNTITGGTFLNNTPIVYNTYQGDQPAADQTMIVGSAGTNLLTNDIVTTINVGSLGVGANGIFFKLFDLDGNTGAITYKERVVINGYLNGVAVQPTIIGTSNHTISGNTVVGIADAPSTGTGSNLGIVQVSFPSAIDKIVLTYDITDNTSGTPGSPGYGIYDISFCPPPVCYNNASATAGVDTQHGITLLKRAGGHTTADVTSSTDWPMVRKSGHTVLESNTKGFVITRMATSDLGLITHPVDGMMVYDTTAKCLKIYVVDEAVPANSAWKCFSTPTCP